MAGEGSYPSSIHPALSNRWVVPSVGVEPTRPCGHLILSQARLPVSPRGSLIGISVLYTMCQLFAISLTCEMNIRRFSFIIAPDREFGSGGQRLAAVHGSGERSS